MTKEISRIDIQNKKHRRAMISHRSAVLALEKIEAMITEDGTMGFYCDYDYNSYHESLIAMVDNIKRWKYYARKYHELGKILKEAIN
jgi:hypothetical protein